MITIHIAPHRAQALESMIPHLVGSFRHAVNSGIRNDAEWLNAFAVSYGKLLCDAASTNNYLRAARRDQSPEIDRLYSVFSLTYTPSFRLMELNKGMQIPRFFGPGLDSPITQDTDIKGVLDSPDSTYNSIRALATHLSENTNFGTLVMAMEYVNERQSMPLHAAALANG